MYWLGIDIGTGGSRALLVDADGRIKAMPTHRGDGRDSDRGAGGNDKMTR